ncbi:MAG: radical SAM protein [Candidatus Hydrogenedentes bacterium]|nr:radical SAM protein [Candidatus Hydrogenedentota bacterium]
MDETTSYRYVFGPVPSRRLGRSLGVDIIPPKHCSLNCVYCQLGQTPVPTTIRTDFAPVSEVVAEVKRKLEEGAVPDHITIAGSGEPTLHRRLGDIILGIKAVTQTPVALLTNGSMLYRPEIRAACSLADVVLPSLDAPDQTVFEQINRPAGTVSFGQLVGGLKSLRDEYAGPIWLEVFLIEGINTSDESIERFVRLFDEIRPDKIQINTAVRPTSEKDVVRVEQTVLERIADRFGERAEVIADFAGNATPQNAGDKPAVTEQDVLDMLRRHPCSLENIVDGLAADRTEVEKRLHALLEARAIVADQRFGVTFYLPSDTADTDV